MATSAQSTDKGIGYTALFGGLAVIGALLMFIGALFDSIGEGGSLLFVDPQLGAAIGFAAAMGFGTVLIVALHVYE